MTPRYKGVIPGVRPGEGRKKAAIRSRATRANGRGYVWTATSEVFTAQMLLSAYLMHIESFPHAVYRSSR